jgi:hypothetical protein
VADRKKVVLQLAIKVRIFRIALSGILRHGSLDAGTPQSQQGFYAHAKGKETKSNKRKCAFCCLALPFPWEVWPLTRSPAAFSPHRALSGHLRL